MTNPQFCGYIQGATRNTMINARSPTNTATTDGSSLCCQLAPCTCWPTSLLLALTICLRLLDGLACLGQNSPATLPDLKLSTAGDVEAMAFQDDGKIIVGGQ